ncbi:MAG TPA: hypothetical protein VGE31_00780 [Candidatus Paceibacterota bacterium]
MFFNKKKRTLLYNNSENSKTDAADTVIVTLQILKETRTCFHVRADRLYPTKPDGFLVGGCDRSTLFGPRYLRFTIRKDHPRIISHDPA